MCQHLLLSARAWAACAIVYAVAMVQPEPAACEEDIGVFREIYLGISGSTIVDLTNAPSFPANPATTHILSDAFETPQNEGDNYGQRLRALLVPPSDGSYTFWIASDNQSVLYLSTDEDPSRKVQIASVASWTAVREWRETRDDNFLYQQSSPISLQKDRRYYIEALMKEGDGGDHLAVRWQLPNGLFEAPIPGFRLLPYFGPPTGPPYIIQQPTNITVAAGKPAAFTVVVSNTPSANFQWLRDGRIITGATRSSYVLNASTPADDGARYACQIRNSIGVTLSQEAVLSVVPDTLPPSIIAATSNQTVFAGTDVRLSVIASGTEPLRYQWLFNDVDLPFATNAWLLISNIQIDNAGSYSVRAMNDFGQTTSVSSSVTVQFGTPAPFAWVRRGGSRSDDYGTRVVVDGQGNFYVCGFFGGYNGAMATFGTNRLFSAGLQDIFFAKYNSEGDLVWVQRAGGPADDSASGLALTADGHCYMIGTFSGTASFGDTTLSSSGGMSLFLAKYSTSGQLKWVKNFGGTTMGSAVAVDSLGNIILAAGFRDRSLSLGAVTLTNAPSGGSYPWEVFIAKLNSSGVPLWAHAPDGPDADSASSVAVDGNGNLYLAGRIGAGFTAFGPHTLYYPGAFVAKYGTNGTVLWAKNVVMNGGGITGELITDTSANIYLSGTFSGPANFGPTSFPGFGQEDIFLAKLNPAGQALWVKAAGGSGFDSAIGLTLDDLNNPLITGRIGPSATFEHFGLLGAGGNYNFFVAKYDGNGSALWAQSAGSASDDAASGVASDFVRNVCVIGAYYGVASFGEKTITNAGGFDVFLAKRIPMPPIYTSQPQSQTVLAGTTATLSVGVQDASRLRFAWTKDGIAMPNQTTLRLVIVNPQISDAGSYRCIVSNSERWVASVPAVLDVRPLLAIANSQILSDDSYTFIGPAEIELRSSFAGGTVFYTLDGSEPSFESRIYQSPFILRSSAVLRSIAYSSDFSESHQLEPINIVVIPAFSLKATTAGGGSVTMNPSEGPYASNSLVGLQASPAAGWAFLGWNGSIASTNPSLNLTLTNDLCLEAVFATTLNTTAGGNGSIALTPNALLWPFGSTARISAIPQPGSYFLSWVNAGSGNTNPLLFRVTSANQTVSAVFGSLSATQHALTVISAGNGRVVVNPRANRFNSGQVPTLTAIPDTNQVFLGWSGDATGLLNPINVSMTQSRTVYANFTRRPFLATWECSANSDSGFMHLSLQGELGIIYEVQKSAKLGNWFPLVAFTNVMGRTYWSVPIASPYQFFRARELP